MTAPVLIGAVCEVAGFASALMLVGATVKNYGNLPEEIAIHFNLRGQANCWGSRGFVLVLPIIGVLMFAVLTIVNPAVGLESVVLGPGAPQSIILTTVMLAGSVILTAVVGRAMIAFNLGETRSMGSPILFGALTFAALAVAMAFYFKAQAGL